MRTMAHAGRTIANVMPGSLDYPDIPPALRSIFSAQLACMGAEDVPVAFGHAARTRSDEVVGWFWTCAIDDDCLVNCIRLTALADFPLVERPEIDYAVIALMTSSDVSLMNEVWERTAAEEGLFAPAPLSPVLDHNVMAFEMRSGGHDLVLPRGTVHDSCNICMRRSFVERLAEHDRTLAGLYDAMAADIDLNACAELRGVLRSCDPTWASRAGAELHYRAKVLEALAACAAHVAGAAEEADLVAQVETLVSASLAHPPTVDDLAERLYVGRTALCERFRRATGTSVGAYVTRMRIDEAKRLLAQGDASVADVARAVGYRSASAFSTAFRRECGLAPSAWRRMGEAGESES